MRRTGPALRFVFVGIVIVLALSGLVARLWIVQIAHGAEYTAKTGSTSRVTVRIPPCVVRFWTATASRWCKIARVSTWIFTCPTW